MLQYAIGGSLFTLIPFYKYVNFGSGFFPTISKFVIAGTILIAPFAYVQVRMIERLIQVKKIAFE